MFTDVISAASMPGYRRCSLGRQFHKRRWWNGLLSPDSESSDPGLVTYPECISYFTEKEGQPQMCSRVLSIWGETMEGYKKVWAPQVKWMSVGSGATPCCHYTLRTQEQESHEYTLLVCLSLQSEVWKRKGYWGIIVAEARGIRTQTISLQQVEY